MTDSLMDYLNKMKEDRRNDPGYILDLVPDSMAAIHGNYASFGPPSPTVNQAANQIISALIQIATDVGADLEFAQKSNRELHDEFVDNQDNVHRAGPGTALIGLERQRQKSIEGYTEDHDDNHDQGEMAEWAISYLKNYLLEEGNDSEITNLVRAGALIAAEIDRLIRVGYLSPSRMEVNFQHSEPE